MSSDKSQKKIPNLTAEDEPSRNVFTNSKGNDIGRTIAWTVEKEVEKVSLTIKKEVSGTFGGLEKRVSQILLSQGKQFCERTSLHGLAYIGEENRPWWDRVFWVLSICSFLLFGGYVMKPIYEKWQFVPTITTIENTNYPIWQIDFPAVTICSNNKVEMYRIDRLLEEEPWKSLQYDYPNFKKNLKLALITTLTFETLQDKNYSSSDTFDETRQILDDFKDNFTLLALKATPSCQHMVLHCEWQGQIVQCGDLFKVRKTDTGFCCSFNTFNLDEQFHSTEVVDASNDDDYYFYDLDDSPQFSGSWFRYSTTTTGCKYPDYTGNKWCTLDNFNEYCDFDGGDCCNKDAVGYLGDNYCSKFNEKDDCPLRAMLGDDFYHHPFNLTDEFCDPPKYPKCTYPRFVGNGYCDKINDNVFCDFDGGDCCSEECKYCYGLYFTWCIQCPQSLCINQTNVVKNEEGCPYPGAAWIDDGICDDVNNNPACSYDGKDCCDMKNYKMGIGCLKCGCMDPSYGPKLLDCYRPLWVGDGFCDDYTNHAGCNFDGGDCCLENPDKSYCHKCECITDENIMEAPAENSTIGTKPTKLKRTNVASSNLGLTILLYPNSKENHKLSDISFTGFRILVHSPYDFPEVSGKGLVVGAGSEAFIGLDAQFTATSEDVLKLPLKKRKCLSHHEDLKKYPEVRLEAFQNYSRRACLLECQARNFFRECGCLPYYYPDFGSIWKKNTACDYKGLQCLSNNTDQMQALQSDTSDFIQNMMQTCNCPNDCDETTYTQELSFFYTEKDETKFFSRLKEKPNILFKKQELANKLKKRIGAKQKVLDEMQRIIDNSSIVHIYFKDIGIVKFSRDQVYTVMDVIAAFGGIIGLCCGFSMISIVEIFYWFTLRIYTDNH